MDKFKLLILEDINKKLEPATLSVSGIDMFITKNNTIKQRIIGGKFSEQTEDFLNNLDDSFTGVIVL